VKSEGYITCDSALKVSGVHSINQVLDQQLTRPEEPERGYDVLAEGNIFGCTARAISSQENHVLLILKVIIFQLHSFTVATVYIRSIKGNYIPVVYIQLLNGQWTKSWPYI
jgi:hypothetical protein